MPRHAPAGDPPKNSPKPLPIKNEARNRKTDADSLDEDTAMQELPWRELADLQYLDG